MNALRASWMSEKRERLAGARQNTPLPFVALWRRFGRRISTEGWSMGRLRDDEPTPKIGARRIRWHPLREAHPAKLICWDLQDDRSFWAIWVPRSVTRYNPIVPPPGRGKSYLAQSRRICGVQARPKPRRRDSPYRHTAVVFVPQEIGALMKTGRRGNIQFRASSFLRSE
jgi:hypothetical protein